ncbi:MAG: response regulator [Flavipsychrobacter sp.]
MKKIIIVEDDVAILDVYNLIFTELNCELITYPNGDELIEGNFPIPDLFILDKQLSGVDGLDICRLLKRTEATKDIPVIMLSASPDIYKTSTLAGANAALEKPFKIAAIRETVRQLLA